MGGLVIHVYVKENRLDITSAGYPVNPPQQHFTGSASTPVCLHCYFCHIHKRALPPRASKYSSDKLLMRALSSADNGERAACGLSFEFILYFVLDTDSPS
mmetsp:Transcript_27784/g.62755  ORF Transcript_27784/g.62755 Transcript_27784/m.62755 type:complete len:100 (+) Transcript_27784:175-474(+)